MTSLDTTFVLEFGLKASPSAGARRPQVFTLTDSIEYERPIDGCLIHDARIVWSPEIDTCINAKVSLGPSYPKHLTAIKH